MTYPLVVRREAFDLLRQGYSAAQAAAVVGVSKEAVKVWRRQVGGVMPDPRADSGRYLSRAERYEIARLHDGGVGVNQIARRIGRSSSTVSRELGRPHRAPGAPGRPKGLAAERAYQPEACHEAALVARARVRPTKLSLNPRLKRWVQDRLDERFSPEQITGRLIVEFPDQQEMRISHETIYRAIYVVPRGGLTKELTRELRAHLRTGRTTRKTRATRQPHLPHEGRRGQIVGAISIHDRPEEVEDRLVPGHYEGDLIVGPANTTQAIGTLVERTSGHLTAFKTRKTTTETITALQGALTRTGWPMATLTWDRGKEMAAHAAFTIDTGIQVYFADPHAPWQRGSNESGNGLLREYFPKNTDLADITDQQLQAAVDQLNNRPRKRHGFLTPNEVLAGILINDQPNPGVATTP